MIGLRHLRDEQLVDCYTSARSGSQPNPRLVDHLAECPACNARYVEFARVMDDLQADATAETDQIFTPDYLLAQRQQIAKRIEHLGHFAKVITFPGRTVDRQDQPTLRAATSRWVAVAAVAGLVVGVGLGAYTNVGARLHPVSETATVAATPAAAPRPAAATEVETHQMMDDDAFLQELEVARGGLRARALMPLDAFTPTVREVSAQLR